ncbi:DNA-binding CsgD family transcriptional regulator/sugar-specific transcriptional regulator TrmB [Actinokineospora baliensis]|uniref:helix-turn-helix transcriptional regulator n=1 Tax=Actinokineospora baliensis TaxID=547056 RepID=UPI001956C16F|nr:LuxR family transcriptional regulator [Actinokineospora baliensis]MBM7774025.1 DNA-binding CsgD family transcriptional regulator/sugar-specific transcriptional regulator TrmB [Actinokineospora baliensis]
MSHLLASIGLTDADSTTYLAVLGAQKTTQARVATLTGLSPAAARRSLATLVEAGLLARLRTRPTQFTPVPTDIAVGAIVNRRERDLDRVLTEAHELARALEATAHPHIVEVVDGHELTSRHLARAQLGATEEVLFVDAPPYLDRTPAQNVEELAALRRGVTYRTIYDKASLDLPHHRDHMAECVRAGEQARTLTPATMKMVVVDRHTAYVPTAFGTTQARSALVVRASPLLDALLESFEWLWSLALPADATPQAPAGPTARQRRLLAMMGAGMKDRAIARSLGVTERTVSRHIHELLTALGADSRFQAGAIAFGREWLPGPTGPR